MILLERLLSAVALAQTILATLRSGSRAVYILRSGSSPSSSMIGVMEGPLILPPLANETDTSSDSDNDSSSSSRLWEISTSFRHSVELALDLDLDLDDGNRDRDRVRDRVRITQRSKARNRNNDSNDNDGVPPYFSDKVTANINLPTAEISDSDSNASESAPRRRIAKISALAPQCFADLRSRCFGISEESFRRSVLSSGPFVSFQSNSKGAARTGGVFFFTRDGAYMIKTIKRGEVQTLLHMLPKYHRFMKRHGRRSLLTRFCGIYQVTLRDGNIKDADGIDIDTEIEDDDEDTQTIVVMNSVFPAAAANFLSERFDLKGSTVGRKCSDKERQSRGSAAVLKDLDLMRESELVQSLPTQQQQQQTQSNHNGLLGLRRSREYYGNVIQIGTRDKAALLSQLRKDVGLLVDCGVIDYSLLVGVVHMDESDDIALNQLHPPGMQPPRENKNRREKLVAAITAPMRVLLAPSFFVSRKARSFVESTLSWPLPYYGSGQCVVDGGKLAQVRGEKRGQRAIFYVGLIDFLQPFDFKKKVEWKLKGFMYKEGSYSCVPPNQYADRFLKFIDEYIS
jgi:1-phosphatidylinositol-4-phosphate 5-kinase